MNKWLQLTENGRQAAVAWAGPPPAKKDTSRPSSVTLRKRTMASYLTVYDRIPDDETITKETVAILFGVERQTAKNWLYRMVKYDLMAPIPARGRGRMTEWLKRPVPAQLREELANVKVLPGYPGAA